MLASRFAAVAALSLSLLLTGCGPGRLHILIPDFVASGVDGLRLFRVTENGGLQVVGRIVFGAVTTTATGLQMQYTQFMPGRTPWGPVVATMKRPATGQVALEMAFYNPGAPGYFRFASYNERGTSNPAAGQIFVQQTQGL
jgi:hypothetical protein